MSSNAEASPVAAALRDNARFLMGVLVVAVAARLIWSWLAYVPPFGNPRDSMSKMYVRSACLVALGLGYGQVLPDSKARETLIKEVIDPMIGGKPADWAAGSKISQDGLYPETLHPPGTSLIGAALWRLTGQDVWKCLQVFTSFYDALGVVLIFLLVLELNAQGVTLARAAAVVYALFPPLWAAAASARDIGFVIVPSMASVWCYARFLKCRSSSWFIGSAVFTGFASYFRPDALLLTSFCCLAHTAETWRHMNLRSLVAYVARPVAALGIALVVLLPWALRNQRVLGRLVFTSTGAGCTLVTGLGTYPNPWGFGRSDLDRDEEARAAGFRNAFLPEADAFFHRQFREAVKAHPAAYLKILARRLLMPLAPPYGWNLSMKGETSWGQMRAKGANPLNSLPYLAKSYWPELLSSAFGLVGLVGAVWFASVSRWSPVALSVLLLPYGYVSLSHVFTHMAPYYLLPAAACQIIGFSWLCQRIRNRIQCQLKSH